MVEDAVAGECRIRHMVLRTLDGRETFNNHATATRATTVTVGPSPLDISSPVLM